MAVDLARSDEAALLQNPDGCCVVRDHAGVERPSSVDVDKCHERLRCDAATPEGPPYPVAHLTASFVHEGQHVACHGAVGEHRAADHGRVGHDTRPVRHERVVVACREVGHLVGERISLVVEEHQKVGRHDLPESDDRWDVLARARVR